LSVFRPTLFTMLSMILAVGGHRADAACTPIEVPAANAGIERMKDLILAGQYDTAFSPFDISDWKKKNLIDQLKAVVPTGSEKCITMRRVRQSDHFLSEVFMTQAADTILYWRISAGIDGSDFDMINFSFSDEFDSVEEFLY